MLWDWLVKFEVIVFKKLVLLYRRIKCSQYLLLLVEEYIIKEVYQLNEIFVIEVSVILLMIGIMELMIYGVGI